MGFYLFNVVSLNFWIERVRKFVCIYLFLFIGVLRLILFIWRMLLNECENVVIECLRLDCVKVSCSYNFVLIYESFF